MLAQLRIKVQNLSQEQKFLLKENISSSFTTLLRTPKGLLQDIRSHILSDEQQDFIQQRMDNLGKALLEDFSCDITPEERSNYILSHILTKTPVDNVDKLDYYFKNFVRDFVPEDKQQALKKLSKQTLVNIELSGIKDINDTFGHAECDKMVYGTISEILELAKKHGLEKYFPMFAYGISLYGMIIPIREHEQISKLCAGISDINSNLKLSASYTRLGDNVNSVVLDRIMNDENKSSTDLLKYLLDCSISVNNAENRQTILSEKVVDKSSIIRYVSRNLKRITGSLGQSLDEETINSVLNYVLEINQPAEVTTQPDYSKGLEIEER